MKNNDLISQLALMTNTNKTQTILSLVSAGYNFQKEVTEQDNEVDEKVSQMLLQTLTAPVNNDIEEVSEVIQEPQQDSIEETTQVPHQDEPRVDLVIDERELQLLTLFGNSKTQPKKIKNKPQLVESVFDILIPKSSKNTLKGRILRDEHKRNHVTQLINQSETKEQLSKDLILWINDFKHKANNRK